MRSARVAIGLLLTLSSTLAQADDAPRQLQPATARAGNFIFQMPKDWTRKEVSGATLLMPPLTRQSADAMLETIYFMASAIEGGQSVAPTQDEKNQWASKLAEQYGKIPDQQKNGIAQMPATWAALRWAWPTLPDAEKEKLKAQFGQFEPVKQVRQVIAAARKAKDENFIATMQRMQRQHETYVMLSRMSYDMHMTNMAAIANMGGNTRYEYRYR